MKLSKWTLNYLFQLKDRDRARNTEMNEKFEREEKKRT